MSIGKIKLDRAAIGSILKGQDMRRALHKFADEIADTAALHPAVVQTEALVYTEDYETDRAVVAVMLDSDVGAGIEARHHVLRDGARAAALDVDGEERAV